VHYFGSLASGLSNLGNLAAVGVLIGGTLLGVFVGVVPGLGGIVLLVVLLPFLYNISPVVGLALLLASHSAIYYAGSTTAILINTPGAPESAATCFDGYAMTRKGRVGEALGVSAAATTYGGWIGALAILVAIPVMVKVVNVFHPPDYFFLTLLAVVLIGQLQASSPTKGVLSGLFGFMLSFVGAAASTGTLRFTFGQLGLYNGVNVAAAAIGLFAISQMFILFGAGNRRSRRVSLRLSTAVWSDVWVGVLQVPRHLWLATKSAIIGVLCGVIPGIGSTAANFLSYGLAMRSSKQPWRFGTGIPEGIIAPEGSSISKEAGALIPTVSLGIPNGPAMAVLLAAFAILGLSPGPSMLKQHLPLVFWMVVVIAVSSLLASVLGLALAPLLAQITVIPGRVLVPFVLVLASIGTYASTTELLQVGIMMMCGIAGLLMRRYGYSLPGVIVGLVLGSTAENNLILTEKLYGWTFFERPLSDVIIAAIIAVLVLGSRQRRRQRQVPGVEVPLPALASAPGGTGPAAARTEKFEAAQPERTPRRKPTVGEVAVDVAWVVGSAVYVFASTKYPSPADYGPLLLGGAALVVAVFQLAGAFVPRLWRLTHGASLSAAGVALAPAGAPLAVADRDSSDAGVVVAEKLGSVVVGSPPTGDVEQLATGPPAAAVTTAPALVGAPAGEADPDAEGNEPSSRQGEALRQLAGVALAGVLLLSIWLFGYRIASPACILAYFLLVRRWGPVRAVIAAAAVFVVFYLISRLLSGVIFPSGVI
jgi:putative tricarboxylic transport membrane protein